MTLLTRAPDLRQAQHTSIIEDIRIWVDEAGADPAGALRDVVTGHGGAGKLIGIERDTQGLDGRAELAQGSSGRSTSSARWRTHPTSSPHTAWSRATTSWHPFGARPCSPTTPLAEAERLAAPGAFEGDHPGGDAGRRL